MRGEICTDPVAHGIPELILELHREVVQRADPRIRLLHLGTEKFIEIKDLPTCFAVLKSFGLCFDDVTRAYIYSWIAQIAPRPVIRSSRVNLSSVEDLACPFSGRHVSYSKISAYVVLVDFISSVLGRLCN